jgi:hypothetical protein
MLNEYQLGMFIEQHKRLVREYDSNQTRIAEEKDYLQRLETNQEDINTAIKNMLMGLCKDDLKKVQEWRFAKDKKQV